MRRDFCFRISDGYQIASTWPWGTSLKSHISEAGPEIMSRFSYRPPSRCVSALPGSSTLAPSTVNEYPHSCSANGPTVTDQSPLSSLVSGTFVPFSQCPVRVTSFALGASSRKVTRLSDKISGETTRGAACPLPPAGGAWPNEADVNRSEKIAAPAQVSFDVFIVSLLESLSASLDQNTSECERPLASPQA